MFSVGSAINTARERCRLFAIVSRNYSGVRCCGESVSIPGSFVCKEHSDEIRDPGRVGRVLRDDCRVRGYACVGAGRIRRVDQDVSATGRRPAALRDRAARARERRRCARRVDDRQDARDRLQPALVRRRADRRGRERLGLSVLSADRRERAGSDDDGLPRAGAAAALRAGAYRRPTAALQQPLAARRVRAGGFDVRYRVWHASKDVQQAVGR